MKFPVKLIHPDHPQNDNPDPTRVKVLTAKNQAELDGLLRIGWKVRPAS